MKPDVEKVRAPNIRDVAALAGVSYQTVSRVLNDSPSIRPATRQRVLDVITEIGYRPNQAARALSTSRSKVIGVLTLQNVHFGPQTMVNAIELEARAAGYRLAIASTTRDDDDVRASLDVLTSQSVEAIIVIAPQRRFFNVIDELDLGLPIVALDSTQRAKAHSLSVDQFAGARLATRHLIDLGHRHIVHVAGPQDWIEADERMQGFLFEMGEADLSIEPPILGDLTADFGYIAGRELLRRRDYTAVFAANDMMALGLLHAFREADVDVPREVSVVGFDDSPSAAHVWPPLTTVRQDFELIGRRALELVLAELDGNEVVDLTLIPPELVVRGSTAHPWFMA
ncbi:LacI family DNA-binding transcriptional regulator [Frigoribacterium sp. 2-23]|uniref:LacI family DNA-binding transcriptional regulator n=1 Tax=Frigoribacterium sp. 2-23 TaxID=3415006 RepID=UPI003C6F8279